MANNIYVSGILVLVCAIILYVIRFMACSTWLQDCLSPLSMQALPAAPESLCIVEMGGTEAKEETGEVGTVGGLFLNTGLQVRHWEDLITCHINRNIGDKCL